jgi:hypothetical protein
MTQTLGATMPVAGSVQTAMDRADPRADLALYQQRDRFIPVSRQALMTSLAAPELWPGFDSAEVTTCFRFMAHWRHLSYAEREQELIEDYLPFNPDRDISDAALQTNGSDDTHKRAFVGAVRLMLERANYDEIPRTNLQDVIDEFNPYGLELDVNLDEFDDILVFVRGEGTEEVPPDFLNRVRGKKPITVTVFHRVFLMLTLKPLDERVRQVAIEERINETKARKIVAKQRKMMPADVDDTHIYIKMFKNVPRPDLEIMFPNTRVKLRSSDKITIGASASGGIGVGVISMVTKVVAAALSPIGAVLAVLGLAGAASQQVAQVVNRRARYMLKMTRNLYFQNLSNNQGALALLTERAEEEDIKEELLLYALLAKTGVHKSELGEAQTAIEEYLADHFRVHVSFDTEDALERLLGSGIVVEHADGVLVAMSPSTAAKHISEMCHGYLDRLGQSAPADPPAVSAG